MTSEEIGREIQEVPGCDRAAPTTKHQLHAGLPFRHLGERHTRRDEHSHGKAEDDADQ
jgi:hypothetical protein